jgi:predicted DNA-binding transcriptional regulator AlpA
MLTAPDSTSSHSSPFNAEETLVNRRVVAAFLGMSESGFVKLVRRGDGPPYYRFGRMMRFSPTAVKAWVAGQVEITVAETE